MELFDRGLIPLFFSLSPDSLDVRLVVSSIGTFENGESVATLSVREELIERS